MKTILFAACAALLFSTSAFAADLGAEITTAQTHAGLAAKATTIDMVHMHMHHALNCLVGPGGAGFDTTNANPCAKSGNGAIPDSMDQAQKDKLQSAARKLMSGVAEANMAAAQQDATEAAATIGNARM